ncbi:MULTISPECIES: cupin domain-containing protein [unclassified Sphingomonas]|nr:MULTISPECIES: cupin domain-containing protein [unclassified Sphingomonas]
MSDKLARRLLVTGHDGAGRSQLACDTIVRGEEMPGQGGMECSVIWGSDHRMHYPDDGSKPAYSGFFPPIDGYRLVECYLPPHHENEDMSAQGEHAEAIDRLMPGVTHAMDGNRPGMHRTETVDLIIVLQGRCVLQLDNGDVQLSNGDILVESGTIHAWTNPFDQPCRFLCAVIGAQNDLCR